MNWQYQPQFICPNDGTSLLLNQPDTLHCPLCQRSWAATEGFYAFLDPLALPLEDKTSFHLHTSSSRHIHLSLWHHLLSDVRSHITNGFIHRRLRREVRPSMEIVDLGCGNGFMRGLLSSNAKYVGVDFDPELLRRATHYHPALYLQASVDRVPLAAEQFDAAITTETMEHLARPECLLREARRLLRPGGLLLLSVPNEYCFKYRVKGHHAQHAVNFDARGLRDMVSPYFAVDALEQRGFWFPLPIGRHSIQVGWPVPLVFATNFILLGHKM